MAGKYFWDKELTTDKDIMKSNAQVIVCPFTCNGELESSLNKKSFRKEFPNMMLLYKHYGSLGLLRNGYSYLSHRATDNQWFACVVFRDNLREDITEKYIVEGIRNLREDMVKSSGFYREDYLHSVAIPKFESKGNGLKWDRISRLIQRELKGCNFDVWLDGKVFLRDRETGKNPMRTISYKKIKSNAVRKMKIHSVENSYDL